MLYAKTIRNHLNRGGKVRDWMDGEPGLCSNGGRYYDIYWLVAGELLRVSSYEDADWGPAGMSVEEFAEWAHIHSNDTPNWVVFPRFELT